MSISANTTDVAQLCVDGSLNQRNIWQKSESQTASLLLGEEASISDARALLLELLNSLLVACAKGRIELATPSFPEAAGMGN